MVPVEAKVAAVREAAKGDDIDRIKTALEELRRQLRPRRMLLVLGQRIERARFVVENRAAELEHADYRWTVRRHAMRPTQPARRCEA